MIHFKYKQVPAEEEVWGSGVGQSGNGYCVTGEMCETKSTTNRGTEKHPLEHLHKSHLESNFTEVITCSNNIASPCVLNVHRNARTHGQITHCTRFGQTAHLHSKEGKLIIR